MGTIVGNLKSAMVRKHTYTHTLLLTRKSMEKGFLVDWHCHTFRQEGPETIHFVEGMKKLFTGRSKSHNYMTGISEEAPDTLWLAVKSEIRNNSIRKPGIETSCVIDR